MRPAMASSLTQRVTPAELADRQQVIETKENIDSFPRLAAIIEADLATTSGPLAKWRQFPVRITLRFGWADTRRGFVTLTGEVETRMAGLCQRCLQPFEYPVCEGLKLLLARPDDPIEMAPDTAPDSEVWELDEEWLRPIDIVEEALIMALPLVARHENSCQPHLAEPKPELSDKEKPFADLRSQMQD